MHKIKIDTILPIFEDFVEKELDNDNSLLSKIKANIENYVGSNKYEKLILEHIRKDFKAFILQSPQQQESFIRQWKIDKPNLFFCEKIKGIDKKTPFCKTILNKLNYTIFRSVYGTKISKLSSVKTCPYCNAMLAVNVIRDRDDSLKARLQLDHFFPKSRYPYLSISLFNLIPSCANCNHSKGNNDVNLDNDFHLYTEDTPVEKFKFKLNSADIIYTLLNNPNKIDISFNSTIPKYNKMVNSHKNNYDIEGLYNTQKDIVEELIWKSQIYNQSTISDLSILTGLPEKNIKRMVIGNYIEVEDIHKRPMAKFMQDIAKDLGLLN